MAPIFLQAQKKKKKNKNNGWGWSVWLLERDRQTERKEYFCGGGRDGNETPLQSDPHPSLQETPWIGWENQSGRGFDRDGSRSSSLRITMMMMCCVSAFDVLGVKQWNFCTEASSSSASTSPTPNNNNKTRTKKQQQLGERR